MTLKRIIIICGAIVLLALGSLLWHYMTHFWLTDTGIRYERPIYVGNNALRYYYLGRTYPSGDDIIQMYLEEQGGNDYGINYSWKRPAITATKTYASYLSSFAFAEKLRADTAQILDMLRARQEREKARSGAYTDGPEKNRGDLLPISMSVPAALLYRYQYRNDPGCVAALIAEDTAMVPAGLRRLCVTEQGGVSTLSDTPAR